MSASFARTVLVATMSVATFAGAASAAPATTAAPRSVEVRFGDLDLADAKGVAGLNQRIARAARSVCRTGETLRLDVAQQAASCRADAIAAAQPKVDVAIAAARQGESYASTSLPVGSVR